MLLFLDIETSGLPKNYNEAQFDPDNWPEIIALLWICTKDGNVVEENLFYLNHADLKLSDDIAKITGISQQMLDEYGRNPVEILNKLKALIADCKVITYNRRFSIYHLRAEFHRYQIDFDVDELNQRTLDLIDDFSSPLEFSTTFRELPGTDLQKLITLYKQLHP